jgi:hypothetical protein
MNFFKDKFLTAFLAVLVAVQPLAFAEDKIIHINSGEVKFQGLYRMEPTKVPNGGHTKFDNVYVDEDSLKAVKGRDRLTTTAAVDISDNGQTYYENQAGSTKKLIIKEASSLVSYATDGSGRAVLVASGLTNEKVDFSQIGDTLYMTSTTDGLYSWAGTGSATAITGVAAPSAVDFSSSTTVVGGMTPGLPIGITPNLSSVAACAESPSAAATGCVYLGANQDTGGSNVTSDDGTLEQAATSSTYLYKVTKYSSKWGIESEPSSSDSASLTGDTNFTWSGTNCTPCDFSAPYDSYASNCCSGVEYVTSGRATSTTGTLAADPGVPFDSYRIYRTVAGGSDYFLLGDSKGFSAAYTDGKPDASLGNPLDTTLDTINPPKARYIADYKGTIFLGQGTSISFSRVPVKVTSSADTFWLATDNIDIGSKKSITGLHTTADSLMVFTENEVKELTGFGAATFRIKNAVNGVGTVSDETIETDINGDLIFFSGTSGVYKLRTFDQPTVDGSGESITNNRRVSVQRLSSPALDSVFQGIDDQIDLDPADYASAHAYYDSDNDLYFLYVGSHCFLYDNKGAIWTHIPATQMLGSTWRKSGGSVGVGVLYDNYGFWYNNWTGYENGIHSGTVTGNPTASGNTTLTDAGATFNTTGDGLKGLWVFLDNTAGEWRQISSNTGTQITVSSAWTTNPVVADSYYIAYIIPDFQSKQYSFGAVPEKTNLNFVYVIHGKSDATQTLNLDLLSYVDRSITAENAKSFDLTTNYVDKIGIKGFGYWHDLEMRTFIYSTSNTIDPPLNLLEYGLSGETVKEK